MGEASKSAIVVGGSIAGLMSAIVLRRQGYSVTVLERHSKDDFHDQGAGLGLRPEAIHFLATTKRTDIPFDAPKPFIRFLSRDGSEVAKVPLGSALESTSWAVLVTNLQTTFRGLKGPGQGLIRFGSQVTGVEQEGTRVNVQCRSAGIAESLLTDLLIAADGGSSTIRDIFTPGFARAYAGYYLLRGTVPWAEVPEATRGMYADSTVMYFGQDTQTVTYKIPTTNGIAVNWARYFRCPAEALDDVLTNAEGRTFTLALSAGQMRSDIVERHREICRRDDPLLLAGFAEKLDEILLQVITNVVTPQNIHLNGQVLLVGEAAAVCRPHAFSGTAQAAYCALRLEDLLEGKITAAEWSQDTQQYSEETVQASIDMGAIVMGPGDVSQKPRLYAERSRALGEVQAKMMEARQTLKHSAL